MDSIILVAEELALLVEEKCRDGVTVAVAFVGGLVVGVNGGSELGAVEK